MFKDKRQKAEANIINNKEVHMNYTCSVCGFKYEEKSEKIPFDQLPEDWSCPICNAEKVEFTKDE